MQKEQRLEIIVSDNGPGIAADVLKKIGNKGQSFNKENGHGLGIYSAKKLLSECGGDFKIESKLGYGTTVSIEIPFESLRMVLVDDDALVRLTWNSIAQDKGFDLSVFESAEAFQQQIDNFSKNVLFFLDYSLGETLSGIDLAKTLHSKGYNEIYLVSGQDDIAPEEASLFIQVRGKSFPFGT